MRSALPVTLAKGRPGFAPLHVTIFAFENVVCLLNGPNLNRHFGPARPVTVPTFLLAVPNGQYLTGGRYVSRLVIGSRCDPGKGLTDAGIVRGHLLRPEQASQFARVGSGRANRAWRRVTRYALASPATKSSYGCPSTNSWHNEPIALLRIEKFNDPSRHAQTVLIAGLTVNHAASVPAVA